LQAVPSGEESWDIRILYPCPEFDRLDWDISAVEANDIELIFSLIKLRPETFLSSIISGHLEYFYIDSGIRTIEFAFITLSTDIFLDINRGYCVYYTGYLDVNCMF